ncbi:MAG: hypothetical protein Q8Q63_01560 [Phaeovulum sp.]|uniref:hypothetical protein n=1 Tax=Phaeovulum sp. TaxID=2934796 RepID=UPI0027306BD5|nr:hypothetical protein [Phaeovulum sp.]MDP3860254.1 hypothetical protein [Phaeovulum sp.]
MSKGPDDVFVVDEVGQLNAWGIQLDAAFHPPLTKELFRRAWETVAHQYEYGDPGYGAIGNTAYGNKTLVPRLGWASGWDDHLERVEVPGAAPYLIVGGVGGEASFSAALIDYGDTFQLRVLSDDFLTEYNRYTLKGWQLADPRTKIYDLR